MRVVLIGASNMTRGFAVLRELSARTWGDSVELLAAIGHGRSYGMASSVLGRRLPAVLDCGLWSALADAPPEPTVAFLGDVGNDILYGAPVPQILEWVEECVTRLRSFDAQVVVTSLPPTARELTRAHFLLFRSLFFPARKLTFEGMRPAVEALDEGLKRIASAQSAQHVELRREWYGFDPIHIHPLRCRAAWREVLSAAGTPSPDCPRVGLVRALSTYRLLPERQWLLGREMRRSQPCYQLPGGSSISLY